MNAANVKLIVYTETQKAELFIDGKSVKAYVISTAKNGLGCEEGSNKTPTGLFAVSEKIGAGVTSGTIFESRVPVGLWSSDKNNPLHDVADNLMLTRILWLDGLESYNANSKGRYIYIHGTNHEELLGTPFTSGCVNMSNSDVIELFDLMPQGARVEIQS